MHCSARWQSQPNGSQPPRSDPGTSRTASPATPGWSVVSGHLAALARAWDSGHPPATADFLPADPPEVRRLVLVELVKLDLAYRLQRGIPRVLEEYLAAFPELDAGGGPPCD